MPINIFVKDQHESALNSTAQQNWFELWMYFWVWGFGGGGWLSLHVLAEIKLDSFKQIKNKMLKQWDN